MNKSNEVCLALSLSFGESWYFIERSDGVRQMASYIPKPWRSFTYKVIASHRINKRVSNERTRPRNVIKFDTLRIID